MKKRAKSVKVKMADELADALGLSRIDAVEMELRCELNAKIIEVVKRKKLTHGAVAKLAGTSHTRITALLNCNTQHISTSLMIRVLAALGVRVKVSYSHMKLAA